MQHFPDFQVYCNMESLQTRISEDIAMAQLKGGAEDFERFVETTKRLVWHVVARMVDDAEDRKDLCQEVFLRIYRGRDGFRGDSRVSTWVAQIAYNICLNHRRKKKAIPWSVGDKTSNASEPCSEEPGPDRIAEDRDALDRLLRAMNRLPKPYRVALTLFHVEEMDYRDIARTMGVPEGTVKSHLFRARRLLKKRVLEHHQKEEPCVQGI
jgi:RNA polymerase sigma-70 factor (ECF subfamily)